MTTDNAYRRPTRVTARSIYPYVPAGFEDEFSRNMGDADYLNTPIYFEAVVEVKVLFGWVSIWAERCRADDTENKAKILKAAAAVAEKIQEDPKLKPYQDNDEYDYGHNVENVNNTED